MKHVDLLTELKRSLSEAVSEALRIRGMDLDPGAIDVRDRVQKGFGDLSTPSVIKAAASEGLDPREVGEGVASLVRIEMVDRVEAVNGYLNFYLDWDAFLPQLIEDIISSGREFGRAGYRGKLVLEHTSVNPTGPIGIHRSRNSIIGDSLCRIMEYSGWKVVRHYLLNDSGSNATKVLWGTRKGLSSEQLRSTYEKYASKGDFRTFFAYVPANARAEDDPRVEEEISELEASSHSDQEVLEELRSLSKKCLEGQLETLKRLDIEFDEIMPESTFLPVLPDILERLRSRDLIVDVGDGSIGLDLSTVGLTRRKTKYLTLVKGNGSSTYTLRDIAYHEWKFRDGDMFITVLGEDHKREFVELKAILELLGHDEDLRAAFHSFVSYAGGKMSTRAGKTVPLDLIIDDAVDRSMEEVKKRRPELSSERMREIAEQVGKGAIKFNILKVDPHKSMEFRWEEAIDFTGDSSAYVQYACARCAGILGNADPTQIGDIAPLASPEERELAWALARIPSVIQRSSAEMKPNYIAEHAIEVATLFSKFYMQHRVLQVDEPLRSSRIALVRSVQTALSLLLELLGVNAPEEI